MYDPSVLEAKSVTELQDRRAEILKEMEAYGQKYSDAPTDILQELAYIFTALRRKTSGPPKVANPTKRSGAPKATVDDLMNMIA